MPSYSDFFSPLPSQEWKEVERIYTWLKKSRVSAQGRGSLQGTEHAQGHSCHLGHRWEAIAFHPGAPSHVLGQLSHCARDQVVLLGNEKETGNCTSSP